MNIPGPEIRLIRRKNIVTPLEQLEERLKVHVLSKLQTGCLLKMEFLTGIELGKFAGSESIALNEFFAAQMTKDGETIMSQIGALCAMDTFLFNWDRIPFTMDNAGNEGNIMFSSVNGHIVTLDNGINPIIRKGLPRRLERVDVALSSIVGCIRQGEVEMKTEDGVVTKQLLVSSSLHQVVQFLERFVTYEFTYTQKLALQQGFYDAAKIIASLDIADMMNVRHRLESIPMLTDVDKIQEEFLEAMLTLFRFRLYNEEAPVPPHVPAEDYKNMVDIAYDTVAKRRAARGPSPKLSEEQLKNDPFVSSFFEDPAPPLKPLPGEVTTITPVPESAAFSKSSTGMLPPPPPLGLSGSSTLPPPPLLPPPPPPLPSPTASSLLPPPAIRAGNSLLPPPPGLALNINSANSSSSPVSPTSGLVSPLSAAAILSPNSLQSGIAAMIAARAAKAASSATPATVATDNDARAKARSAPESAQHAELVSSSSTAPTSSSSSSAASSTTSQQQQQQQQQQLLKSSSSTSPAAPAFPAAPAAPFAAAAESKQPTSPGVGYRSVIAVNALRRLQIHKHSMETLRRDVYQVQKRPVSAMANEAALAWAVKRVTVRWRNLVAFRRQQAQDPVQRAKVAYEAKHTEMRTLVRELMTLRASGKATSAQIQELVAKREALAVEVSALYDAYERLLKPKKTTTTTASTSTSAAAKK